MDVVEGRKVQEIVGSENQGFGVHNIVYSPDGRYLAASVSTEVRRKMEMSSAAFYYKTKVWDLSTGIMVKSIEFWGKENFTPIAFSPDGRYLAGKIDRSKIMNEGIFY